MSSLASNLAQRYWILAWCKLCWLGLWSLFIGLHFLWVILDEFPRLCSAFDGFVAHLVTVETCDNEYALLFVVIWGGPVILTYVRSRLKLLKKLWQMCTHQLLILVILLNKVSVFIQHRILFACNTEVFLDGNRLLAEQESFDILVVFRVKCLIRCSLEVL